MIDEKMMKTIENDIANIIAALPPEAKKHDKIAAICRKHRMNRKLAEKFL